MAVVCVIPLPFFYLRDSENLLTIWPINLWKSGNHGKSVVLDAFDFSSLQFLHQLAVVVEDNFDI